MPIKQGTGGMSAIYQGSNNIAKIYKGSDLVYQIASADQNVIALLNKTITNVTADMIGNITDIGAFSFYKCTYLKNIELPEGITSIGQTAFQFCSSLEHITLPSTITSIGMGVFSNSENLKSMTILATTPPELGLYSSISTATETIYGPSSSISAYETANQWSNLLTASDYNVTFVGI